MDSRHLMARRGTFWVPFDLFLLSLTPRNLFLFLVITITYFVTGKFGQQLATFTPPATAFWPPTGIAIAAIFLQGRRAWPGIFLGAFLVNFAARGSLFSSFGIGIGNTLEAVIAVHLVSKFANGVYAFFRPRDVLRFILLAGIVPSTLCATWGVGLIYLSGALSRSQLLSFWQVWWLGDLLGAVIVGPFLILFFGFRHRLKWPEIAELAALFSGLTIVCLLNFGPPYLQWVPTLFFSIPFLIWAGVRFCPLEVAAANLIFGGFSLSGSLRGFGPYANTSGAPFTAAAYILVYSVAALLVVAALMEQRKETESLYQEYCRLRNSASDDSQFALDAASDQGTSMHLMPVHSREAENPHHPPDRKNRDD